MAQTGATTSHRPRVLALVGPTAVGKTRLAFRLAESIPLEVVAADSRTVYRGMDIATAKPTPAERKRLPHHLLDVIEPDEPYSIALYQQQAQCAIDDITRRGRLPALVGGAGLYVSAVCDGLVLPDVPPDHDFRERLEARARDDGWQSLQPLLAAVDPVSATRIDPRNVRRVIRALEVQHATGRPFSTWQQPVDPPPVDATRVGLWLDYPELWQRIDARVDAWLAGGLIDEVRELLARGFRPDLPSMSSLGYREVARFVQGELSLDHTRSAIKIATHQYARRQMTWFRRDLRITWFNARTVDVQALRRLIGR